MNYYEHHIGDYAEATAHLTFIEDAAYSRMIRKYYAMERPLPADIKAVQRLVGARTKDERDAVESVLREFFALQADGWHQTRCDADLQRYIAKQDKARASANARWLKPHSERNANALPTHMQTDSERNANASKTHNERNALQSPVPSPQTPEEDRGDASQAPPTPSPAGTRLPKNWELPDDWKAWSLANRPDLNPADVAERFRDFWHGKAGKDGRKADWFATWRNWCRGEKPNLRAVNGAADDWTRGAT